MSKDDKQPRRLMSLEDIEQAWNDIASDPDHRDRTKALKALSAFKSSSATLPPPLTDDEVVERMSFLMKSAGVELCRRSFRRAFRKEHGDIKIEARPVGDPMDELPPDDRARIGRLQNLRDLYRLCPALKRGGLPKGYPVAGDVLERMEWIRDQAAAYLVAERRGNPMSSQPSATKPPSPA